MKHLIFNYFFIDDLPEGANCFDVYNYKVPPMLDYYISDSMVLSEEIILPPGNWKLIGWSDEITEEQIIEIVEKNDFGFKQYNYSHKRDDDNFVFISPFPSFSTLLKSKGIKQRCLILKNDKP